MSTPVAVDSELWEELARRCGAAGAFGFGVSLLDVLTGMGEESRVDFLRNVVEHAVAAAEGVRTRDGLEFGRRAAQAFGDDGGAKLRALDEYIRLRGELPELSVAEFFTEVVGVPDPEAGPGAEDPALGPAAGGPLVAEGASVVECGDGAYSMTLLPADSRRVDAWLGGDKPMPEGEYGPVFEAQVPLFGGHWLTVALCSGERGPWVDAYVVDGAGMERATFEPRAEFFGEYACTVSGRAVKVAIRREGE